jgi:G:T-mismatch repair DNA endonuclease (very short patch repair protein)
MFQKKNKIIVCEFHGDDVHGHERYWINDEASTNRFGRLHKTAYEKTMARMEALKATGYKIIWIWESQFNTWKKQVGTSLLQWPGLQRM